MRQIVTLATVVSLSALPAQVDAQKTAILRSHRAIEVLPTTIVQTADLSPRETLELPLLFQAELRLALRASEFEVVDGAPISAHVVLDEHSGCRPRVYEWLCLGGVTDALVVFSNSTSNEMASVRIRVRGSNETDRIGPLTAALEDWENFANVQHRVGGRRYLNFNRSLIREISRLK